MARKLRALVYVCLVLYGGCGATADTLTAAESDAPEAIQWLIRRIRPNAPPPAACQVAGLDRLDCYPDGPTDPGKCAARNCCWSPVEGDLRITGIPWCFFPSSSSAGYNVTSRHDTQLGFSAVLKRGVPSSWPHDVMTLQLDVMYEQSSRLHFKIYDPSHKRYEVPIETPKVHTKSDRTDYSVTLTSSPFSLQVKRSSSGTLLFDTSVIPLTFADQLIQIGTRLPTNSIYGLGEHRQPLLINASQTHLMAFWSRDQPPTPNVNLYGDHAFFLGMEADGQAFGVFLLNSNAKEVNVGTKVDPVLIYTTIGGILDFYIFTGPSPDAVIQQYLAVIGHTFMPPYWALGFHLCRWGYGGADGLKKVIERMRAANMPYDTQWTDIDYMDKHLDWTYDKNNFSTLPQIVADLHSHGQHYMIIVDPGISNTQPSGSYPPYDDGLKNGVFIMKEDGSGPIIGKVWPGTTAYPDFTNPKTVDYWARMAKSFHDSVPFDGLWTDMNEPSNFGFGSMTRCPANNTYDSPPYTPGVATGKLPDKTICPSSQQYLSQHYNLHSMYGHFEGIASNRALVSIRQNRSMVISRSTFPSSGKYMGHWTGDNDADWENLYYSIPAILNFNMFGIPLVGADICGFGGSTTEELCTRWMQLGAFYPFMRNHNAIGSKDQDPAAFSLTAQDNMRGALILRYIFLPYLYTLFYNSHVNGTMVARPLFFEFPNDPLTYSIDKQFLWGQGLLISPVLQQGKTSVDAYFPSGTWYDLYTGKQVAGTARQISLDAPLSKINVHVQSGVIIPMQIPGVTTTASRLNEFGLVVALDTNGYANGELFWDDGDTLDTIENGQYNLLTFTATPGKLTSSVARAGYQPTTMTLGSIKIFGVQHQPSSVIINSSSVPFTYDSIDKVLMIRGQSINMMSSIIVNWS